MNYSIAHVGINVLDLEKSLKFYKDAFDMDEVFRLYPKSGVDMIFSYLATPDGKLSLQLTKMEGWTRPYSNANEDFHICFTVDDLDASYKRHAAMGIITEAKMEMKIYFVNDPDGHEIAITLNKCHPIDGPEKWLAERG